jgi:hypothetical protein
MSSPRIPSAFPLERGRRLPHNCQSLMVYYSNDNGAAAPAKLSAYTYKEK